MTTATLKPTKIQRLEARIADLQVKRSDLREQLWRIAGASANADRERALDVVERQLGRAYVELAGLEG